MTAELDSDLEPVTQVKAVCGHASDQKEGRDRHRAISSKRVNIYFKKKNKGKQSEKTCPENQDIRIKVSTHNNSVA